MNRVQWVRVELSRGSAKSFPFPGSLSLQGIRVVIILFRVKYLDESLITSEFKDTILENKEEGDPEFVNL